MNKALILIFIALIGIGFYSLLVSRNLIKAIIALQVMIKGGALAIILAGNVTNRLDLAQSMALTVIVADTIVATLGIALALQAKQLFGDVDIKTLTKLRR